MRYLMVVMAVLSGLWAAPGQAATFYKVDLSLGPQFDQSFNVLGNAQLTGTIITDGTLGALTGSNILGWSFTYGVAGVFTQTIDDDGIAGAASADFRGTVFFADGRDLQVRVANFLSDRATFRNGSLSFSFQQAVIDASRVFLGGILSSSSPFIGDTITSITPQNTVVASVPLPAALPLVLTGLAALGVIGRRRLRQAVV